MNSSSDAWPMRLDVGYARHDSGNANVTLGDLYSSSSASALSHPAFGACGMSS